MSTVSEESFKVLGKVSGSFIDVADEDDLLSLKSEFCTYDGTADQALTYFYKNGLYTDIVFEVRCGDGYIRFPCHKVVLSIWSPVFAGLFFNNEISGETVEITKVPPSAFEVMIKYCYGLETELQKYRNDINFLLKVYKGAKEYKIKGLQLLCCEIFSCSLPTKDNVFELLDAASFIASKALKHRCYKVLQTQTKEIIESRDLSDITRSVINIILEMTALSLESEYELITWMFEWGSRESAKYEGISLREIMTPFLPRLNFLSLKPKEFGLLVLKYKEFFDEKEGLAIFMNIVCPESLTPFLPRLNFLSLKPKEFGLLVLKYKEFFGEKEGLAISMNIVCPESLSLPSWLGTEFTRSFINSQNTEN